MWGGEVCGEQGKKFAYAMLARPLQLKQQVFVPAIVGLYTQDPTLVIWFVIIIGIPQKVFFNDLQGLGEWE